MKKPKIFTLTLLLLAACGGQEEPASGQNTPVDLSSLEVSEVVGVGKVEPENEIIDLAATSGGVITGVFKNDAEAISEGELLVQLDDALEQAKISQIRSQIQTQQSQVAIEENNLKDAGLRLDDKKRLLATTQNLVAKGAETQQVLDDLHTEVELLKVSVEKAKTSIRLAQNQLTELSAQLREAEIAASQKQLRAPFTGMMLDMLVHKGSAITQYDTYAQIAPEGKLMVRAEVDELFSQRLKTGQPVDIRYTGTEEVIAKGKVVLLSPYLKKKSLFSEKASDQEDRRVREIRIALDNAPDLIINSKVECIIKL